MLLAIEDLQHCDFIGNVQQRKWNKDWMSRFSDAGKVLKCFEEGDSDDDDAADSDEDEPSDDEGYSTQLSELCEKLD